MRIAGLDALRGLAAMGVALTHFSSTYYAIYDIRPEGPIVIGAESVALFFIISGFVILMTLDRSQSVIDFIISRFSRLYPVFWVSILITFSIVHLVDLPGRQTTAWSALVNATMVPSFFGHPAVDVVYWSLTVEIYFYIIAGAIFALGLRSHMLTILCVLMVVGTIEHYLPISGYPGGYRLRSVLLFGFWPLFIIGMTIYQMCARVRAAHVAVLALCILCSALIDWRQALLTTGLAAAVFCAVRFRIPGLASRPLLYLGTISYSFYLIHANVGYCIMRSMLGAGWGQFSAGLIALCVTMALASALCFLVERPSNIGVRRFLNEKLGMARLLIPTHGTTP